MWGQRRGGGGQWKGTSSRTELYLSISKDIKLRAVATIVHLAEKLNASLHLLRYIFFCNIVSVLIIFLMYLFGAHKIGNKVNR